VASGREARSRRRWRGRSPRPSSSRRLAQEGGWSRQEG
jgi:hypothetical protein